MFCPLFGINPLQEFHLRFSQSCDCRCPVCLGKQHESLSKGPGEHNTPFLIRIEWDAVVCNSLEGSEPLWLELLLCNYCLRLPGKPVAGQRLLVTSRAGQTSCTRGSLRYLFAPCGTPGGRHGLWYQGTGSDTVTMGFCLLHLFNFTGWE